MGGTLEINWTNAATILQSMVDVGQQAGDLDTYFDEHVVVPTGLDYPSCALRPIGEQLEPLGEAFSWMRRRYQRRWVHVIRSYAVTLRDAERTDNSLGIDFGKYMGDLGRMPDLPDAYLNVDFFDIESLTDALQPPGEGGPTMKHDKGWKVASEGYDATRDSINEAIGVINKLGAGLPTLPKQSLEDFIIYPLAGNYAQLQGNATACEKLASGFNDWAANFGRLALKSPLALEGQAGTAYAGHMGLYSAVMLAVGQGVKQGKKVFDAIATMSEKIAVKVERALVKLSTKLAKLLSKLSSKLSPIGWIWFAQEVLEKGHKAVTDIYHDIMDCKDIITTCMSLAEEIEAWAEVMAESLKEMQAIKDMVEQLPRTDSADGLDGLPPVDLPQVKKDLGEVEFTFDDKKSPEEQDLEDQLDDLETDTGSGSDDSGDSDDFDDEDGIIMAPGPIGEPPYGGTTTYSA